MDMKVVEIDPEKKYLILVFDFVREETINKLEEDWEVFLKDENRHLLILDQGLILRKVERKWN